MVLLFINILILSLAKNDQAGGPETYLIKTDSYAIKSTKKPSSKMP